MESKCLASVSGHNLEAKWWSKLWSVLIPNKVKIHVWRAFIEPFQQGVVLDTICPRCRDAIEDSCHTLWMCPDVRKIWSNIALGRIVEGFKGGPVSFLCLHVATYASGDDFVAFLARDNQGLVLGVVSRRMVGLFSPHVGECMAVREAVVDNRELSMEGPIMEDIKLLFSQLQITGIHHICRSANHVAHLLARFGFNSNCTNVWISETPTVVSNAVSIDAIA
ncbi:hypothetical protein TIFTF001_007251 [Ficus carica]|uniref:Reverse transcriptase zinc-binding domain-containing protein n=1 Tax=Ficus carica TaxID=3494 RepID=A0AA87ZRB4_FICCA|nr:hypothetical protein TIFTF001_007251 [Ficus carica]